MRKLALIAALVCGVQANAAELVTNGGFETGDFTGWTVVNGGRSLAPKVMPGPSVHSGSYGAAFFDILPRDSISQTIDTVVGATYQFSFWLQNGPGGSPNDFIVEFGGFEVLHYVNAELGRCVARVH